MIRQEIKNSIKEAIKELQKEKIFPEFEIPEILIEKPENPANGDYATNIAMRIRRSGYARIKTRISAEELTPIIIAETLVFRLNKCNKNKKWFEKIEAREPGFINFFISPHYLQRQVGKILKQGEKFGQLKIGKEKRVSLEFISANPTGQLHIGHGRGAFFGDALANVLEKAGYNVEREYFINDAKNSNQIRELGKTAMGQGTVYLNPYLESRIKNYESKIKKFKDKGAAGSFLAQVVQRDIKNFIAKKLKIKFDRWFSEEKELYGKNKIQKIYERLKNKNLVYQKEGAWWLRVSEFGLAKEEVLIRQTGEPTYFLSDIAYHKDKFARRYKKIIDIWGADHQGHIPRMTAAAKILKHRGIFDILISQVVRLRGGLRLSKRKGEIITLEDLVNEVSLDVARFFYLTKSLNTQMEFDLNSAREQSEKNPVYYIQYAHARICAILRKFGKSEIFTPHHFFSKKWWGASPKSEKNSQFPIPNSTLKLLVHPGELNLIKQLIRHPEIVEDAAKDYQIQRIPQYALDLATVFHQFYRDCRVISKDKKLLQARLALILATKIVLKNTLGLMGISAPEKM